MYKKIFSMLSLLMMGLTVSSVMAQNGSLSGTVTDSTSSKDLAGANIYIPSLQRGASVDAQGNYEISNLPSGTYKVRATFIGYSTKMKTITIQDSEEELNFQLVSENLSLDKLVVVGFGKVQKKKLLGAVSSVSSDDISSREIGTVGQALQGKAAGVQVTSTSGVLGAPVSVRVRGTSSVNASSQPLYVVDGVPQVNQTLGYQNGVPNGQGGGINALVNLTPNQIQSIQVLKGPSATAVYGARGANGVVLISTKSGQSGETQISVGVSGGVTSPIQKYDLMSAAEYAQAYNYKFTHDSAGVKNGKPNFFGSKGPLADPDSLSNPNYPDIVTRTGVIQNYTASVSGGDENTQFYMTADYRNHKGYADPNQLQKFSALAKINHQFNDKLNINLSINPSRSVDDRINTSNSVAAPYTLSALISPAVPKFTPDGDINVGKSGLPSDNLAIFAGTPYGNKLGIQDDHTITNIQTVAGVTYDFLPELELKTHFSVQYLQSEEEVKDATYTTDGYPNGIGSALNSQFLNYSWRNTVKYSNDWDKHSLTALAGITFQRNEETSINLNGNTFLSNELLNLNSAANIADGGGFGTSYAFQNNLLRLKYSYDDRYILTLTGSLNGSSRFGSNQQYGFFPAIAGGWVISNEKFAQEDWLSQLKLRASYGVTGNANGIGNYANRALLGSGKDYNGQPGLIVSQLSNPELSWESTKALNLAVDYGFFNNRLRGSIGYYRKKTTDLLLPVSVSPTNGFTSFSRNTGILKNHGFEFEITADLIRNKNLDWQVSGNIATLTNKVTDLPSKIPSGHHVAQEGYPIGEFRLKKYMGVDPENGNALYADSAGNPVSYQAAPLKLVGDPQPDFYGGFATSVNYKGFDANLNFQYQEGNKVYWQNGEFLATNLSSVWNNSRSQLDYWTPQNTGASVPEPRSKGNGNDPSTRYLEDGSYLRLKSATIGYTLPRNLMNGNKLRIYAQGTNLLTFTGYAGLDPEVTGNSNATISQGSTFFELPQPRVIKFGIQLGL